MFMLEFQLVIPYHNRHTHCPRLSPYVMSDLEMVYIQHGTVRDSHMWQVWHIKSGWSSRGVIGLRADAIWLASNAYMARYMSRNVAANPLLAMAIWSRLRSTRMVARKLHTAAALINDPEREMPLECVTMPELKAMLQYRRHQDSMKAEKAAEQAKKKRRKN